jgi:hypothetical protein
MRMAIDNRTRNAKAGRFRMRLMLGQKSANDWLQPIEIAAVKLFLSNGFSRPILRIYQGQPGFGCPNVARDQQWNAGSEMARGGYNDQISAFKNTSIGSFRLLTGF